MKGNFYGPPKRTSGPLMPPRLIVAKDSNGFFQDIRPRLMEVPLCAPATKISTGSNYLAVLVGLYVVTYVAADQGQIDRAIERLVNKRSAKRTACVFDPGPRFTASKFIDLCFGDTIVATAVGDVRSCCDNNRYQLAALVEPEVILTPTRIEALSGHQLVHVTMGEMHSIGLSSSDGTSNLRTLNATILVQNLTNNIKQVTAGPRQSYCSARQGHAYALGSRVSDQLCVGEQVYAKKSPFPMVGLRPPILKVPVGAQHVIVLAGHPAPSSS
ncbi:HERC3 [Branchiostoma lanceolatum]|uniref:HERC3 protein n=1 Tax=Branchiostoma lanceolatum TaxID=7740 RepID=A0A8J9Z8H0_BRALA|nr:HERC3 [Branchiostoma lanceolatum]